MSRQNSTAEVIKQNPLPLEDSGPPPSATGEDLKKATADRKAVRDLKTLAELRESAAWKRGVFEAERTIRLRRRMQITAPVRELLERYTAELSNRYSSWLEVCIVTTIDDKGWSWFDQSEDAVEALGYLAHKSIGLWEVREDGAVRMKPQADQAEKAGGA